MSRPFFTADLHLYHKNIIEFQKRPFSCIEEMHSVLIKNWNNTISQSDTVYILGDFCFGGPQAWQNIVYQLNGEKHLIIGNHDKKIDKISKFFESCEYYKEITVDEQKICMCHYPIAAWNKMHRGSWNLHGHCHSTLKQPPNFKRLDVGIDNPLCNFTPFSYEQIEAYMDKILPFKPIDHHGDSR